MYDFIIADDGGPGEGMKCAPRISAPLLPKAFQPQPQHPSLSLPTANFFFPLQTLIASTPDQAATRLVFKWPWSLGCVMYFNGRLGGTQLC